MSAGHLRWMELFARINIPHLFSLIRLFVFMHEVKK